MKTFISAFVYMPILNTMIHMKRQ